LRVLYLQGALTWAYKFVNLALHNNSGIKITGLTRTSKQSVFRQNVESAGELLNGFPTSLEELAPFRVVVLSNLRPAELSPAQQDVLQPSCLQRRLCVRVRLDTLDRRNVQVVRASGCDSIASNTSQI